MSFLDLHPVEVYNIQERTECDYYQTSPLNKSACSEKTDHFDEISALSEPAYVGRSLGGERKTEDRKMDIFHEHDHLCNGLAIAMRQEMVLEGIIKPKPKEESTFAKLYCDERDRLAIAEVVKNIAEHGKFWLLKNRGYMTELGDSVRHVHPLKFLEVVFTNDYLIRCLWEIFDDFFKRYGFLDGLGERLTVNSQVGELDRFIPDFAKSIQVDPAGLRPYFEVRDWEGLLRYLMSLKLTQPTIQK